MADDNKEPSIEEILAAARQQDGGEEAAAPEPDEETAAEAPAESAPAADKPAGEMSVEDMLASARGESTAAAEPAEEAVAEAAPAKPAGEMSVEDMLASARGEGSSPAAAEPEPDASPPAKKKPAASEAAPAASTAAGPRDSGSLLGTRKENQPGPMTNDQARDAGQETPELKPKKSPKEAVAVPPMPEKPAYVQPEVSAAAAGSDRRSFFSTVGGVLFGSSLAVGFTSLAVTHVLWLLGLARFMFPNILIERPTQFKVGFPDDFAPGQVATKFKAQFGIWVVRYEYDGAAQIYALKTVCTHLGCTPNWLEGEQKFKCPCHGSGFYKDGINFEGPAPRPLERYAIQLADDGQLEIDKSRKFNEELGQWADPASYVNV